MSPLTVVPPYQGVGAAQRIIGPHSDCAIGDELMGAFTPPVEGSVAWPTSGTAFFYPFVLSETFVPTKTWYYAGTAVGTTPSLDIAIFDEAGNRQWATGAQTPASTSTVVEFSPASPPTLAPGRWYCGMVYTWVTTPGQVAMWSIDLAQQMMMMGVLGATGLTTPFASSVTYAKSAQIIIPVFGVSGRTLVA